MEQYTNNSVSIKSRSWNEFQKTGMFWFINRTLHLFGWVLVWEADDETGEIINVHPCRTEFRGFPEEVEEQGFKNVTNYLAENIETLKKEANG